MAEKIFEKQVNYGWGLSLNMTGKAPAVAKRIFNTLADAQAFADDFNDSAIEGLVLSVVADDADKNGVYFVQSIKTSADTSADAVLVKLGSASDAVGGASNALTEAKKYTDAEVKKLADGAVKTNTDAITVLNGDVNTNGSVAKAVATEKGRAEAKELELNNAITAETAAREAADEAINDTIGTVVEGKTVVGMIEEAQAAATTKLEKESDASHLKLTQGTGTSGEIIYTIGESDIASASVLTAADVRLTKAISDEASRASQAEAALAGRVQTIEDAPYATTGYVGSIVGELYATVGSQTVAEGKHVAVEVVEENGKLTAVTVVENDIASASGLTAETNRAKAAEEKALTDAKAYTDVLANGDVAKNATDIATEVSKRQSEITRVEGLISDETTNRTNAITALNADVTSAEGTKVRVQVVETAGKITAVNITDVDIASAAVLAEVKEDVDNFFKDASFADNAKDTLKELQDYINSDASGATAMQTAIANNKKAIEDEVARAQGAEAQVLVDAKAYTDEKVAAEKTRAEGKEGELKTLIDNEITARAEADTAINDKIGDVAEGKTVVEMIRAAEAAAIAAATIVAEDSEFITIEKTGEVGRTQTYTIKTQDVASASATTSAIATEKSRAEGKESELNNAITAETATRQNEDSKLSQAIAAEKTRAEDKESELNNAITAETKNREDAIAALNADVTSAEGTKVRVQVVETAGKITAVNITDVDIASATGLTAEINARTADDNAIKGRLDVLEGVTVTGKDAIVVSSSDATESKVVSLKLGAQPGEGVAGVVLSQNADGLVAKLQWGTF